MLLWNGKEYVRFGGPVETPSQTGFLKIDEWKKRRAEWLAVSVPEIKEVPNFVDRLPIIREQEQKYRAMNDYFMAHVNKLLPPWK